MVCSTSCVIATIFIVAMIFTMYGSDKTDAIQSDISQMKGYLMPKQNSYTLKQREK
jgi:hypothetical protein